MSARALRHRVAERGRATPGVQRLLRPVRPTAPPDLAARHTDPAPGGDARLVEALDTHFFTGWRTPVDEATHRRDLDTLVTDRLHRDRHRVVPWLDASHRLDGARVLEIGCGTGASTVALAEQGARVTGIDIDEGALEVAAVRLEVHGLDADLRAANATELEDRFDADDRFDLVVYFATLEHLTLDERLVSLPQAWQVLAPGGHLVVIETPNRLWWHDHHTALVPFFHWLPDELALDQARHSPRADLALDRVDPDAALGHLRRLGRGVSWHEFDAALGPDVVDRVVSSLGEFEGRWHRSRLAPDDRRYADLLARRHPDRHRGWFDPDLDLVIAAAAGPGQPAGANG